MQMESLRASLLSRINALEHDLNDSDVKYADVCTQLDRAIRDRKAAEVIIDKVYRTFLSFTFIS